MHLLRRWALEMRRRGEWWRRILGNDTLRCRGSLCWWMMLTDGSGGRCRCVWGGGGRHMEAVSRSYVVHSVPGASFAVLGTMRVGRRAATGLCVVGWHLRGVLWWVVVLGKGWAGRHTTALLQGAEGQQHHCLLTVNTAVFIPGSARENVGLKVTWQAFSGGITTKFSIAVHLNRPLEWLRSTGEYHLSPPVLYSCVVTYSTRFHCEQHQWHLVQWQSRIFRYHQLPCIKFKFFYNVYLIKFRNLPWPRKEELSFISLSIRSWWQR